MTTLDEFQISPLIRVVNTLGGGLVNLKLFSIDVRSHSLRAVAERQTGLSDWGSEDFWPGFEALCHSFAQDEKQTLVGYISFRIEALRRLRNRLLLEQVVKREPGILASLVRRPLFIIGFPRTGTSMLHRLLTQAPNVHVPLYWKLHTPLPLNVSQAEINQRIKSAESFLHFASLVAPKWTIIHPIDAHQPEECVFLLSDNLTYSVRAHLPEYIEQYLQLDLTPVYRNYRQHLQALQWQQPEGSWVLKSPLHLWSMEALLKVFPDARIVMTHRDPKKAFPSWCSLTASLSKMTRKDVDPRQTAKEWLPLWKTGLERAQVVRAAADPGQFFDMCYADLMADPLAMVRQIYAHFGDELTPEAETAMSGWLTANAHGAHEGHRYDVAQYGIRDDQIEREFRDYTDAFAIPLE